MQERVTAAGWRGDPLRVSPSFLLKPGAAADDSPGSINRRGGRWSAPHTVMTGQLLKLASDAHLFSSHSAPSLAGIDELG